MRPPIFTLALGSLIFIALSASAQPSPEPDWEETLVLMRDHLDALQSYEATVTRSTIVSSEAERVSAEVTIRMAWERPNSVDIEEDNPLTYHRVLSDGEQLYMWRDRESSPEVTAAPATFAEIDAQSGGLASSGMAIGGLFFADDPISDLAEGFDSIHDLGVATLDGIRCHLIGMEQEYGLRMIMWVDTRTWLPIQVVLDATSVYRDTATQINVNSQGARMIITERHRDVQINALNHSFALED